MCKQCLDVGRYIIFEYSLFLITCGLVIIAIIALPAFVSVRTAPSAGIDVKVQQISGGMVELTWSPIPVELLRGFLRNYTLYYRTRDQPARSESLTHI